jgi:hypothetical protein
MTGAREIFALSASLVVSAAAVLWLSAQTPVALQAGPFRLVLGAHDEPAIADLASAMTPRGASVAVEIGRQGIAIAFRSGEAR